MYVAFPHIQLITTHLKIIHCQLAMKFYFSDEILFWQLENDMRFADIYSFIKV